MRSKTIAFTMAFLMAAAIAAMGVVYKIQRVDAFNPQPDPPGYGLVGITNGQTIRITVTNTGDPPEPDMPGNPARVVLTFRDGNGNLLRNADGNPVRRTALLKGGESTSLDLNGDDFARTTDSSGRIQLRPVVQIQQGDLVNGLPPDPCIPSAEVFNNANGRTQFMMPFIPAVQRSASPTAN